MKIFQVALGILAAIGGFVDIGDLVFNVSAGATFGYQLLWVVVIGVVGIIVYSEMCGRVAAVSGKAVFDAVRERLGFRTSLAALISAQVVNLMTLTAEIGGVAICLQLLSGLPYRWLILIAGIALALIVWVTSFDWIERIFGYGGLCLLVFAVGGASIDTLFSGAYNLAQFLGWEWGRYRHPSGAPRFTVTWLVLLVLALGAVMTGVDPVQLTEYAVIFSAVALPLTYIPILLVANDRSYMGNHVNGRLANTFGLIYLVVIVIISVTAVPLMILTHVGQN